MAITYSADEPERLRGPQHDDAWCDEVGAWRYPQAWDNLMFGLRLGVQPRTCVTTTPRSTNLVKALIAAKSTVKTGGSTYDNRANLAPTFFDSVISLYEGTALGAQEIYAEMREVAEGAWFPGFSEIRHVSARAEFIPSLPVRLAIDCGTSRHTGAVWFQVREAGANRVAVNVFGEYLAEGLYSQANAEGIRDLARRMGWPAAEYVRVDPASGQRTGVGPAVYGEYERVFGRSLAKWPLTRVVDGLDLVDVMLGGEGKLPEISIHPRCVHLIAAFKNFRRKERNGEYLDEPLAEDHPHEDMMDALRGGLMDRFPDGRRPQPKLITRSARGGRFR